ncbi:MAG TPA: SDR family NAD(P)-dependent oxidoreductase [Alphaproteobacteria bacterium]|jgi:NAD(P)-dependent dehydrogenase (short-subunit alcohol dehydrogenase family)|nr:SDR family NAD(P)-dependent oxidoreductase [Alphaproteobacteria bacterium]MDP7163728.1 SDR family NAD(P)-dependent oxidoreductase [Alphaproteobacteria bacterium]MDP7427162.1 SDR family NAD(P)-dependent oxidoreductase [Alphaproteobacteria bacterium]HJM50203.1 SDR family NAD(P)-dependent oxidoreductase [Alphaproteobacteria bacterium]
MTLENKIAIVTGAAQGIGRASAERLAAEGADVALFDINPEVAEVARAVEDMGRRATTQVVDIADPEAVRGAVAAAAEALGPADILANVAGIVANIAPLTRMTPEKWQWELGVNLGGTFNMIQASIQAMIDKGWGRIVNVSSTAARGGLPGQIGYSASKAGLLGVARNVAVEHGRHGVTCNTVLPGFIETETVLAMPTEIRDGLMATSPVRRFGTVEEVANVIAFLCGPQSGYLNGAEIDIDGGQQLNTMTLASRKAYKK